MRGQKSGTAGSVPHSPAAHRGPAGRAFLDVQKLWKGGVSDHEGPTPHEIREAGKRPQKKKRGPAPKNLPGKPLTEFE